MSTPSSRSAGWAARCVLIRIINTGNEKLWLWFGLIAGLGLETKHSMLIFGFGLVAGLVLTPQRKHLF